MAEFIAIITAAGSGSRMGAECKKQFLSFQGKSIIERTIEVFFSFNVFNRIVVVLPREEFDLVVKELGKVFPMAEFVRGGALRQDSIANALIYINKTDFVFVHDGVRPFVQKNLVERLRSLVQSKKAVIPAVPITNTLKQVDGKQVVKTVDRSNIFGATTPQAFSFDLLQECYQKAICDGIEFTDDASLLESLGYAVFWVKDEPSNIKITTPFDLLVAKVILEGA